MPIYEYACKCGYEFEFAQPMVLHKHAKCPVCGNRAKQEIRTAPRSRVFLADWYEHIAPDPIYCGTPQELREACDKHGGRSAYLQEGFYKTSPGMSLEESNAQSNTPNSSDPYFTPGGEE